MSSVTIITSILVLLVCLIGYAFIAQAVAQRRQQKERLLVALKARVRNFKFILNGFPPNFLPKELALLVQRSLMQLLEQLAKLERGNATHKEDLKTIAQQMAETQRQPPAGSKRPSSVENPQQAREIKTCLEELYKFIFQQEGKSLSAAQAEIYRGMIRHLVLQLNVDAYVLHARIARDKGKLRLAIHYLDLALKLMVRERTSGQFDARIAQIRTAINDLESHLTNGASDSSGAPEEDSDAAAISSEWDNFIQESTWKKKQLYD